MFTLTSSFVNDTLIISYVINSSRSYPGASEGTGTMASSVLINSKHNKPKDIVSGTPSHGVTECNEQKKPADPKDSDMAGEGEKQLVPEY